MKFLMGQITKTPFIIVVPEFDLPVIVILYLKDFSSVKLLNKSQLKPLPYQCCKSSLVALTAGPRGVQLWHMATRFPSCTANRGIKVLGAQVHCAEPEKRSKAIFPYPIRIDAATEILYILACEKEWYNSKSLYGQCIVCIFSYFDQHCFFKGSQYERWRKNSTGKNTFHINVKSPKDLSCDVIIASDQRHGTTCPALRSMLACLLLWILVWSNLP